MNLARLNHLLIPSTKTGRDRLRTGRWRHVARLAVGAYRSLTEEGRTLAIFWLLCGAFGLEVRVVEVYILWCAVTGLLIGSLLFHRFLKLEDVALTMEYPKRVTVGDPMTMTMVLTNHSSNTYHAIRAEGPLLPWDGHYNERPPAIPVLQPNETVHVPIETHFVWRGEHHLDPFYAAMTVPLGLALGRSIRSRGTRFLVLPEIAKIQRFDTPMTQRFQPGGVALASQTGESREIAGLRPYRAGDPVRDICPRAWARVGFPVVREYQQEYFTRIGVVVDTDVAAADDDRFEAAISLAAGVVSHLARGEALIDLIVVGDELHRLTLGRSLGFIEQALDLLACVKPGPTFDTMKIASVLSPHLDRLSSIVLVALDWDAARQDLIDRIERQGVGCRTLLVSNDDAGQTGTLTVVPTSAITRKEPLWL